MAITKATILTQMQERTLRTDVTDIDDELKTVLQDLSSAGGFLERSGTVTMASGGISIALPTGANRGVASVARSDKTQLTKVTFRELMSYLSITTGTTGLPARWAVFGEQTDPDQQVDYLYTAPVASAETILTVYYEYDSVAVGGILFPDRFQECIIEGVCFKVLEGKGLAADPIAVAHKQLYDEQLARLSEHYKGRPPGPK